MSDLAACIRISIGNDVFFGQHRREDAPGSWAQLDRLLPYAGEIIHARWSGEAIWVPLGGTWPLGLHLPPERATDMPAPGEALLFAGSKSEPELLVAYGTSRFACKDGPLQGNPIFVVEEGLERLSEIGRSILRRGAMPFRLECVAPSEMSQC